jgi:hypothetical protein
MGHNNLNRPHELTTIKLINNKSSKQNYFQTIINWNFIEYFMIHWIDSVHKNLIGKSVTIFLCHRSHKTLSLFPNHPVKHTLINYKQVKHLLSLLKSKFCSFFWKKKKYIIMFNIFMIWFSLFRWCNILFIYLLYSNPSALT